LSGRARDVAHYFTAHVGRYNDPRRRTIPINFANTGCGMFFSFDGVDGVGKSTQAGLFGDWLRDSGHDVVACRDPGSTRLGEVLRRIVVEGDGTPVCLRSEMLLYMAARAQLVDEIIGPALEAGKTVVSDRFLLANVVYQGHAGGLDPEVVWQVGEAATAGIRPVLTFVLDMKAELALARIARGHDRMERQGLEYLQRVRDGFLTEAKRRSEQIVVVDASGSVDEVQTDVRRAAERVLKQ